VGGIDIHGMLDHHRPDILGLAGAEIQDGAVPLLRRVRAAPVGRRCKIDIRERPEAPVRLDAASDHFLRQNAAQAVGDRLHQVEMMKLAVDVSDAEGLGFDGDDRGHGGLRVLRM